VLNAILVGKEEKGNFLILIKQEKKKFFVPTGISQNL
jgi:hypothetical protein